jgi:hypothetical protein
MKVQLDSENDNAAANVSNRLLEPTGVQTPEAAHRPKQARNGNCGGKVGGRDRDRTCDLMLAKHALSQLSYTPIFATAIV